MNVASSAAGRRAVIFDGDDTLWRTEELYDQARAAAREAVQRAVGRGGEWEELQRRIDVENVAVLGFSPQRFPTSCVQAYRQLSQRQGAALDCATADAIRMAAEQVFSRDPELVPGVHATLTALRDDGFRLALLTKGDFDVQRRRVAASGLEGYFTALIAECASIRRASVSADPQRDRIERTP